MVYGWYYLDKDLEVFPLIIQDDKITRPNLTSASTNLICCFS